MTTFDQLPAIIIEPLLPAPTASPTSTCIVPALITDAGGEQAGWRFVEFFTANINNDHTRRAYARACSRFFAWCENRGLTLTAIRPFDVAAWVKELQQQHGAPEVKQQLAAVRMLFDWLVTGQVVPINPAAAVRGPSTSSRPARRRCSRAPNGASCSTAFPLRACGICATAP